MLKIELLFFIATAGALLFVNRAAPQSIPAAAPPTSNDNPTVRGNTRAQRKSGNFTPATAPMVLSGAGAFTGGNGNQSYGGAGGGFAAVGNGIVGFAGGIVGMAIGAFGFAPSDNFHQSINNGINASQSIAPFAAAPFAPLSTAAKVAAEIESRESGNAKGGTHGVGGVGNTRGIGGRRGMNGGGNSGGNSNGGGGNSGGGNSGTSGNR